MADLFFWGFFCSAFQHTTFKKKRGGGEGEKEREQPGDGDVNEEGKLEIHGARKEKE